MTLTFSECFWYAVLYAFVSFGTGYWILGCWFKRWIESMIEAVKRMGDEK